MITRGFRRIVRFDARATWAVVLGLFTLLHIGCDRVALLAPINSSIQLTADTRVVPTGGTTRVQAIVLENSGQPVPNGTTVRFTTSLGRLEPLEAQTSNGVATTTFFAGTDSGIAEIRAVSGLATASGSNTNPTPAAPTTPTPTPTPNNNTNTNTNTPTQPTTSTGSQTAGNVIQITVGAAAVENVTVRANPGSVGPNGGTVTVTALVTGVGGRALPGIQVAFNANNGQISPPIAVTNELGEANATLTTDRETNVTATAGTRTSSPALVVGVRAGPGLSLTCGLATGTGGNCASVTIGQSVSFTVTPQTGTGFSRIREVVLDFGDGESVNLGAVSAATTVGHSYAAAGNFTARATATDTSGEQVAATQVVRVTGPIGLSITATAETTRRVRATATVTGVGSASVVQYEWTFEGAQPNAVTTDPTAVFTYTSGGTKTITVRVTLTDGRTATATTTIDLPS